MAMIQSGASADLLTVDPTSKAARVTLYDATGNALLPNELYRGAALINVRQSAASVAATTVWAIHNPTAGRTVAIKKLLLTAFFDGTAAATLMKYEIVKATGVSAFSGGTVVTPLHKKTSLVGNALAVARLLDTGLTLTGATFGSAMGQIVMGRVTQTTTNFQSNDSTWDYSMLQLGEIELAQNEALAIRVLGTAVIGDNVIGTCEFAEK